MASTNLSTIPDELAPATPVKLPSTESGNKVKNATRAASIHVESPSKSPGSDLAGTKPAIQHRYSMLSSRAKLVSSSPDSQSNIDSTTTGSGGGNNSNGGSGRNLLRPASTKSMKEMFEENMREQNEEKRRKLRELNLSYKIPVADAVLESSTRDASESVAIESVKVSSKEDEPTLAERKLNSLRQAKAAKEARLAQYLEGTESTISLKQRYELARSGQRESEIDRLGRIKGMNQIVSPDAHAPRA